MVLRVNERFLAACQKTNLIIGRILVILNSTFNFIFYIQTILCKNVWVYCALWITSICFSFSRIRTQNLSRIEQDRLITISVLNMIFFISLMSMVQGSRKTRTLNVSVLIGSDCIRKLFPFLKRLLVAFGFGSYVCIVHTFRTTPK